MPSPDLESLGSGQKKGYHFSVDRLDEDVKARRDCVQSPIEWVAPMSLRGESEPENRFLAIPVLLDWLPDVGHARPRAR